MDCGVVSAGGSGGSAGTLDCETSGLLDAWGAGAWRRTAVSDCWAKDQAARVRTDNKRAQARRETGERSSAIFNMNFNFMRLSERKALRRKCHSFGAITCALHRIKI